METFMIEIELRPSKIKDFSHKNTIFFGQIYFIKRFSDDVIEGPYYIREYWGEEEKKEFNVFFKDQRIFVPVTPLETIFYPIVSNSKKRRHEEINPDTL